MMVGEGEIWVLILPIKFKIIIRKTMGASQFWWMKVWVGEGEILVLISPTKFKL